MLNKVKRWREGVSVVIIYSTWKYDQKERIRLFTWDRCIIGLNCSWTVSILDALNGEYSRTVV